MIYFEQTYVTIEWDEQLECVSIEWLGFVESPKFRSGMDKAIELIKEKNASRWLANLSQFKVTTQADQVWLANDWFPRAVAAGIRYAALVTPKNVLAQLAVKNVDQRIGDTQVLSSNFDDLDQAKDWLRATK